MPATARPIAPPAPDDHSLPDDDHANGLDSAPGRPPDGNSATCSAQLLARLHAATRRKEVGHD